MAKMLMLDSLVGMTGYAGEYAIVLLNWSDQREKQYREETNEE